MANVNYDPNAKYDNGQAAAGSGKLTAQVGKDVQTGWGLTEARTPGLQSDGTMLHANHRVGFNAIGVAKTNGGPNVIGSPRAINATYIQKSAGQTAWLDGGDHKAGVGPVV